MLTLRRHLATAERSRKQKDLSQEELRRLWDAQTTSEEKAVLRRSSSGLARSAPNEQQWYVTISRGRRGIYRNLLTDGQPFVREIAVQEVKDSEPKAMVPSN